ncbi:hypothetical protein [Hymenobacter baengnokdamensis]|uniref:hypothetical protein n=1 Tax=Hymenobacter baengnokdamensis TaxID=2615203 RepID=UPI0012470177|nr:hypothetical protein [Hymenobacter baengnokdamensis]
MNFPTRSIQPLQVCSPATEQSRQRLVAAIIFYTNGIPFLVKPSQQQALDLYSRGRLTIDEVVYYLESAAKHEANAA